ncbi:MAG: alpha/beta fold hydrolase [Rhodospirillaceae bacterium]
MLSRSMLVMLAAALSIGPAVAGEGVLEVPGGRIAYESCTPAAARRTVVLIHDGTLDSAVWNGVFPILCQKYRTVRFDHRGVGKSPHAIETYSAVEDIGLVMKGLGVERAVLVGASANGGRAATFALDHPEAVEALVLVGPSIPGVTYSKDFIDAVMPFIRAAQNGDESTARRLAAEGHLVKRGNAAAHKELVRLLGLRTFAPPQGQPNFDTPPTPIVDRLPQVTVRTLVIVGDSDHPDNIRQAKVAGEKIPGADFMMMKDAAHLPFLEHPPTFADIVIRFLEAN